jgi:hypothetical protein
MKSNHKGYPSVVYGCIPTISSEYTFYQQLNAGLKCNNWLVHCVTVGKNESELWDNEMADSSCKAIAPHESKSLPNYFLDWCISQNTKIGMPMNSVAILNCLDRLPETMKIVVRCSYIHRRYETIVKIGLLFNLCESGCKSVANQTLYYAIHGKYAQIPHFSKRLIEIRIKWGRPLLVPRLTRYHHSSRLKLSVGSFGHHWVQRTPAIAAKLANHQWTYPELFAFKVPPPRWIPPIQRGRPSQPMIELAQRWAN